MSNGCGKEYSLLCQGLQPAFIFLVSIQCLASARLCPLTRAGVGRSVGRMKTVSTREFYHNTKLVDSLPAGGQLLVTSNGKPKFVVTRSGARPRMTVEMARARAVDLTRSGFDSVAFLRSLKK